MLSAVRVSGIAALIVCSAAGAAFAESGGGREETVTYVGTGGTVWTCGTSLVLVDEAGGVCFNLTADDREVVVQIHDTSSDPVGALLWFEDGEGDTIGPSESFCASTDALVPPGAHLVRVRFFVGPLATENPCTGTGLATTGEVTATIS